jgi:3'-5' exoribonuclease
MSLPTIRAGELFVSNVPKRNVVALGDLAPGEVGDFFALLAAKDELTTREGKPYFKATFRDARREAAAYVWADAPLYSDAASWRPGEFYKLRAAFRETNFGPQIEVQRIRGVTDGDHDDGFDAALCLPRSRFDPEQSFARLLQVVDECISDAALKSVVRELLEGNRAVLLALPAAMRNHHACVGGFLEHVVSVTETCCYLAEKYVKHYPQLTPPLDQDLVVAGAVLHDIGKVRELEQRPTGGEYTPSGRLIGHILQGRDMLREAAARHPLDPEKLLRLEHLIVAHQRLAEWGSPKPPMTPEALIVHYADDLDAKLYMMVDILTGDGNDGPFTSNRNPLGQAVYRGPCE